MQCIYIDLTSSNRHVRIVIFFFSESLSVFINAITDDEAIWFILSGLYTVASGSNLHTVQTGRKNECNSSLHHRSRRVESDRGGRNKKFETTVRIKHFACNKRMWLENLIE